MPCERTENSAIESQQTISQGVRINRPQQFQMRQCFRMAVQLGKLLCQLKVKRMIGRELPQPFLYQIKGGLPRRG